MVFLLKIGLNMNAVGRRGAPWGAAALEKRALGVHIWAALRASPKLKNLERRRKGGHTQKSRQSLNSFSFFK